MNKGLNCISFICLGSLNSRFESDCRAGHGMVNGYHTVLTGLDTYAVSLMDRMRHYECRDRVSITLLRANRQLLITDASRQEVITNMAKR